MNSNFDYYIFFDGSVNNNTHCGIGASLILPSLDIPLKDMTKLVQVKRFENTSSTKLELQTLMHILNQLERGLKLRIYTDSQNIVSLLKRRIKLEGANFMTSKRQSHRNASLYKDFFTQLDKFEYDFVKVRGHSKKDEKSNIDMIFKIVDKASRKQLRAMN